MLRSLSAGCLLAAGLSLTLTTVARPTKASANDGLKAIVEFSESVEKAITKHEARLKVVEKELKELQGRDMLTDAQRKKLDDLVYEKGKVQLELAGVRKDYAAIKDTIKKQGDDIEELKKTQDKLKAELDKLSSGKIQGKIKEIEDSFTEFKAFTRMIEHRRVTPTRAESWIELEAEVDKKKIPLGNKKVTVFRRFKEGELTPFAEVVTDKNGIAVVTEPVVRGQAGPQYLVFQFAGDEHYRKCEGKTHIK